MVGTGSWREGIRVALQYFGDAKNQSRGSEVPKSSQGTSDRAGCSRLEWASWGAPSASLRAGWALAALQRGLPEPSLPSSACHLGAIDGGFGGTHGVA